MVIVITEGAGQDLVAESIEQQDASGNKLLKDGLWMSLTIKRRKTQQTCDYGQNVGEDAVIVLVNSVAEDTQCTFEVMFGLL
ncbi:hypothetical protein YC2023_095509 [Brassica napus]